jgi:hypothetical protein
MRFDLFRLSAHRVDGPLPKPHPLLWQFSYYDDEWFGAPVSVLEMDGKVDSLEELVSIAAYCQPFPQYF